MTNREHKKLLRAIRHQQQLRDNQMLAKKIDRAFIRLSEGCSDRIVRATSLGSLRDKKEQEAPQKSNRLYYSKPTREMGVTCVGRQKMKLGSKPLI